jgi:arabinan endo-1,5-alpha-L-arabinosidase
MTNNDVWAPDLEYYRGRYYCFYSVSEFGKNNSAIGLVSCSSISRGDWRDDGVVVSSKAGRDTSIPIWWWMQPGNPGSFMDPGLTGFMLCV